MKINITAFLSFFLLVNLTGNFCFGQSAYKIQTYKYNDGLPSDNVLSIVKKEGYIYLGTQRGLCLYDGYRFLAHNVFTETVSSLFVGNGLFFSSGNKGICELKNFYGKHKTLTRVNFYDADTNSDHYDNILQDYNNRIWCSDQNNLKFLDKDKIKSWRIDDSGNLSENQLQFFPVRKKEIWAATPKGIFVWDEQFKKISKHKNPFLAENAFCSGYSINDSEILLADFSGKLFKYEVPNRKINLVKSFPGLALHIVQSSPKNNNQILVFNKNTIYNYNFKSNTSELIFETKNEINTVFYDDETKIIWVGTNRGLHKIISYQESITNITILRKNHQTITAFAEDRDKNLWMVNGTSEIYCLKKDGKQEKILPDNPKLIFTNIFYDGQIVISADDGVYIVENKKVKKIIALPFSVKKMIKDYQNQYWILTEKNGIKVFDATTFKEKKNRVRNTMNYWKMNTSNDIAIGKDKKIWLASWMPKDYGISYYDDVDLIFKEINNLKSFNNTSKFITDYYNRIAFTKDRNLLFSGYGGWNLVSPNGKIIHSFFTEKYKVANDHLEGIAEDSRGNIWFATAEGLYQYSFVTDKIIRISQIDGLESNDVTFGFYKFFDDRIALASDSGIQILNLENLVKTQLINKLSLTSVIKDNVKIPFLSDNFTFDYNFTELDFNFSALTYSDNEKIVYRYRFSDESKWNYLGTNPKLSLIKLPPGNYRIIIQAGDNLGNWQSKELKINLNINPPFYLTIWFIVLMIGLLGFCGYLIARYFLNQEKEKSILKQRVKDVEMQTLRSQMNPHFLFNSLNSINSFIIQQKSREASIYLNTFSKLMRSILDNSRQESISLEKEIETLEMYMKLEMARLENSFDYEIEIDHNLDAGFVQVPPLILQPFVENAIWHGLNNKKENGNVHIKIMQISEALLSIKITDNGIGRKASAELKKEQIKHKSYGIEITKERLELLNPANQIIITDLEDENGNAVGTMVELKIVYYD